MKPLLALVLACVVVPSPAQDLYVDFNSTNQDGGPHNAVGYQPFDAADRDLASFTAARSYGAFGGTVSLQVDYPDSSAAGVQRMIDRGSGNDANWSGTGLDLVTDWIGVDTRSGNGNYDGSTGRPTRLDLTLTGLPAGTYTWRSYHHDTEHVFTSFRLEISTDGGASSPPPISADGTDSTPGGTPSSPQTYSSGDPTGLPSTTETTFAADGSSPVRVRFTPIALPSGVHQQILVLNAFDLERVSEPGAPTGITFNGEPLSSSAPAGTTAGSFVTVDETPGDTFTYALVTGDGDLNNGLFDIVGDSLRTASGLEGASSPLSVRIRTTDAGGGSFERSFLITLVIDSDGDGLEDSWELDYFASLSVATGSGNNDGDALDNLGEFVRNTDPTDEDSDDDGLLDDVETATGIYVSPSDTGSDPNSAQSDGDGLDDGTEVSPANGFVTDPNLTDTDGDLFADNIEISEGTDPTLASSKPEGAPPFVINEIVAANASGLLDGDGSREDWIELYNPNPGMLPIAGYSLSDDPEIPAKWTFPAGASIAGNGYLVVFASGDGTPDTAGNLHTNFKLESSGEFLGLFRPDGMTQEFAFTPEYPKQVPDLSYGVDSADGTLRYFDLPTPGFANGSGVEGLVADTNFSVKRGFYDAPIAVEISSDTPGAQIRYTLDGSKPAPGVGTVYTGPVPVTTTTTLRAMATFENWRPTNVDTHTYIFPDDVATQPADPPGWPAGPSAWGTDSEVGDVPSDYEMDPRVVDNTNGLGVYSIREALLDIPTVAVSMDQDDFTGGSGGLYTNPRARFERECAIEYILPDGSPGFQEDCKIETHGNSSRRPARMQKHSLRLTFSSEVGIPKLRYPLFEGSPVEEFNKLVLRACFTDSWALASWGSSRYRPNDSQYIRDVWMKDSLAAMGQPSSYGNFVHLYVNGLYFGLHNLTERLEDDWYSDHIGGEKEDWIVFKDFENAPARWREMMGVLNGDIASDAVYQEAQEYIDIENYIDYMLLHFYADSEDWPHHNGYAAANVGSGDGKFRFFVWDQEIALDKFTYNRYSDGRGGAEAFQRLRRNPSFLRLFADRARKHLFDGGALSEEKSVGRYLSRADEIDKAIVAESARWGDVQATTPYGDTARSSTDVDADYFPPTLNNPIYFTREQHWLVERDNVTGHYIPTLHDLSSSRAIANELRSAGLYPDTAAPVFSQHGGNVPPGFGLTIGAEETVYYTLDGTDPSAPDGSISANAIEYVTAGSPQTILIGDGAVSPTLLSALVPPNGSLGTSWAGTAFDDSAWTAAATGALAVGYERSSGYAPHIDLDVETVMYSVHPGIYLRYEFPVTDPSAIGAALLDLKYDDGFIAYLNGVEIASQNRPASPAWDSVATGSHESAASTYDTSSSIAGSDFVAGTNVLAIHGMNGVSATSTTNPNLSSDFLIEPRLVASGAPAPGDSIPIESSVLVRARARSASGEWSALTEAFFSTGDLQITEIHYNPPGPDDATEFLELTNTGTGAFDLTGASFTQGIDFTFPDGSLLAPGERFLLVRDQAAFTTAYPGAPVGGVFENGTGLENSGETLTLVAATGETLLSFRYDDDAPWPAAADGDGYSLVFRGGTAGPASPGSWRPSAATGGNPGTTDGTAFPGGDAAAFTEYALRGAPEITLDEAGNLRLTVLVNLAADDLVLVPEVSDDLGNWGTDLYGEFKFDGYGVPTPGGVAPVSFSLEAVAPLPSTLFFRLKMSKN